MKRTHKILTKLHKKPGIYIISCTETDKVYIGENLDIDARQVMKDDTAGHFNKSV